MGATICFEAIEFQKLTVEYIDLRYIETDWLPELQREWLMRKRVRGGRANFKLFDIYIEDVGKFFRGLVNKNGDFPDKAICRGWINAINYELEMKRKCYPRWLKTGKISKADAKRAYKVFEELFYFFNDFINAD